MDARQENGASKKKTLRGAPTHQLVDSLLLGQHLLLQGLLLALPLLHRCLALETQRRRRPGQTKRLGLT